MFQYSFYREHWKRWTCGSFQLNATLAGSIMFLRFTIFWWLGKMKENIVFTKKNLLKQIYSMSHVIKPFLESLSRKRPLWDISKIILTLAEIKSQWLREIHVKTCEGPVGWLYHIWSHLTCCSIFTSSYMKY